MRSRPLDQAGDPPPEHLYKFHSLDGQRREWLRRLIQEGLFYFSRPADFNDPFDTLPVLTIPRTKVARQRWLARIVRENHDALAGEAPASIAREMGRTSSAKMQELFQNAADTNAQALGVLCLTAKADQILMWSHYASSHSGVCLRLKAAKGNPPASYAWRVRYQTARAKLMGLEYRDPQRLIDALITKADFWAYEEEWRAMAPDLQFGMYRFDPSVIDGVVFGARMSTEDRQAVEGWCNGCRHPIEFFEAVPSREKYRLEIVAAGSNQRTDGSQSR